MKTILINNLKVVGAFFAVGLVSILLASFVLVFSESGHQFTYPRIIGGIINWTLFGLFLLIPFGNIFVHYIIGKRFLGSTGNYLLDSASFILMAVFFVVFIYMFHTKNLHYFNPINILLISAHIYSHIFGMLVGKQLMAISVLLTSLLPIIAQYLGIFRGNKV